MEVRDAIRSGDHWWTSFTRQRVRKAIRLVNSDFEAEGEIDFAPVEHLPERVPVERSPKLPRRNKDIEVEDQDFPADDSPLPGWDLSLGFGDVSGSRDAQIPKFDDFFSGLPYHPVPLSFAEDTEERHEVLAETSRVVNGAMNHLGSALLDSQRESRIWRFKAEKNANDLARLQEETLERDLRDAADHAREIRRARRQAKREIAAEMQNRATPKGGDDEVTYPTEFGTSSSDDFILY
ncbi:hypothetical protein Rs2_15924 [Raphanus sativus]|nr:hypothetical protein Rs2_15924 [Raphanus sativus]